MRAIRDTNGDALLHQLDAGARCRHWQARLVFPACPRRIARSGRSLRTRAGRRGGQKFLFSPSAKTDILWKLDRKTGKFLDYKETVFQNVFDSIDKKTGEPHYRNDIVEQQPENGCNACPSTEGGHNWQAMSYHPGTGVLIIPLSQSCMEMFGRKTDPKEGGGAARPRTGASSKCPAPTATSASSPRTTSTP